MSKYKLQIGNVKIGDRFPPVFFAEIGTFFNQDIKKAKLLINKIVKIRNKSSTPIILKTEVLHNPDICLRGSASETYFSKKGKKKVENLRELIERKVISLEKYKKIFDFCKNLKIPTVASVYDEEGAQFASENVDALKIASPNIIHHPLLKYASKLNVPIIIDTGRAELFEIKEAVKILKKNKVRDVIIEHSPDGHPSHPIDHNLKTIQTFKNKFKCPVGLSDHYAGDEMLYVSIGLGVNVLEKGIIDQTMQLDQDVAHAMLITDLPVVLEKINNCWKALGNDFREKKKKLHSNLSVSIRMGVFAKKDLHVGQKLKNGDFYFAFPCKGLYVNEFEKIKNKKIIKEIKSNQPLKKSQFR